MSVRNALKDLCLGALGVLYSSRAPVMLMYHGVEDRPHQSCIAVKEFEAQMKFLRSSSASFLTIEDVTSRLTANESFSSDSVCITFDDAYARTITNILPILEEYRVPVVVYAPVEYVQKRSARTGIDVVDSNALRQLSDHPLITIGSHSMTHPKLAAMRTEAAVEEVSRSKAMLEEMLAKPVDHFAYPYGNYDDTVIRMVEEAGYRSAVTVDRGYLCDSSACYTIPRINIDKTVSMLAYKSWCAEAGRRFLKTRQRFYEASRF